MPKVSDDYLSARRQEILDAARTCFVRNGFHATSMQDLLREIGLSAGAVYRYFPSKDDMIVAIARDAIHEVATAFREVAADHGSFGDALAAAMAVIDQLDAGGAASELALQVWAEAVRNPVVKDQLRETMGGVVSDIEAALRSSSNRPYQGRGVSAHGVAATLLAVLPGYLVQRAVLGPGAVADMPRAVRALIG